MRTTTFGLSAATAGPAHTATSAAAIAFRMVLSVGSRAGPKRPVNANFSPHESCPSVEIVPGREPERTRIVDTEHKWSRAASHQTHQRGPFTISASGA